MTRFWVAVGIAFLLSLSAALAGCVGGDDLDEGADQGDGNEGEEPTTGSNTGAIEGEVASEQFEDLDAQITLFNEDRSEVIRETQAEGGSFAFGNLEPATYTVQARHAGHRTTLQGASVQAGEVAQVKILMDILPSDDPFIIEDDVRGRIHTYAVCAEDAYCTSSFFPFVPWENARGTLKFVDNESKTLLLEMQWTPAGTLGEHLSLAVYCDDAVNNGRVDTSHPCFSRQMGTSPLVLRVDEEHALEHGYDMDQEWRWFVGPGYGMLGTWSTLGVDAGASYEQTYTVYFSYFQREAAPEGYSGLPDS